MSTQERIELLEEIMDLDPGTLKEEDVLTEYDEWDSVTALSLIAEMDARFGKKITGEQIKTFVTVADAIAIMQ